MQNNDTQILWIVTPGRSEQPVRAMIITRETRCAYHGYDRDSRTPLRFKKPTRDLKMFDTEAAAWGYVLLEAQKAVEAITENLAMARRYLEKCRAMRP
jgi:hypothetical protein